jgi:DNA-binding PadR family transcriptional regulator
MRNTILKNDILILEYCVNEEKEQYKMKNETNLSYPSILRALHKMKKIDLISITKTEPSLKGGKDKNFWKTTEKGKQLLKLLEAI